MPEDGQQYLQVTGPTLDGKQDAFINLTSGGNTTRLEGSASDIERRGRQFLDNMGVATFCRADLSGGASVFAAGDKSIPYAQVERTAQEYAEDLAGKPVPVACYNGRPNVTVGAGPR